MGVRRNGRNYAENVCRWAYRNGHPKQKNLLRPKAYSDEWEKQMKRGLTVVA
jgi:hypothetical protein